jgi:pentose-5-phosphate-3-epimerase
MQLSASIYSSKHRDIADLISELSLYSIDFCHIDSIENEAVFEDIKYIKSHTDVAIDLHIISKNPEKFYTQIEQNKVDRVSIQIEAIVSDFHFPKFENTQVGLAIQIGNPQIFEIIESYQDEIAHGLLMTTTPGISGGAFKHSDFDIIRKIVNAFPKISWQVDGGVNNEVAYILRILGVESIVIGNYLMNHDSIGAAIMHLKSKNVASECLISDFMIPISELPIVSIKDSFQEMLQKMEDYKLGTVFCVGQNNHFEGIITNADIRKCLLAKSFDYSMSLTTLINKNPKKIKETFSIKNMLSFISQFSFPLLVLPVENENCELVGAISFHKLIKGD